MRTNDRARKKVAFHARPGESIRALIALNHMGPGWASSGGTVHSGGSLFSTPYAQQLGVDFDDPRLRAALTTSWCAVVGDRLLFFAPSNTSIRPTPAGLVDEIPMAGTSLRWFDSAGLSVTTRVVHLDFPDDTRLLSATLLKARVRRKTYNDEPDLFVAAFGAAASQVTDAG